MRRGPTDLQRYGRALFEAFAANVLEEESPVIQPVIYAAECFIRAVTARSANDDVQRFFAQQLHDSRLFEALVLGVIKGNVRATLGAY